MLTTNTNTCAPLHEENLVGRLHKRMKIAVRETVHMYSNPLIPIFTPYHLKTSTWWRCTWRRWRETGILRRLLNSMWYLWCLIDSTTQGVKPKISSGQEGDFLQTHTCVKRRPESNCGQGKGKNGWQSSYWIPRGCCADFSWISRCAAWWK